MNIILFYAQLDMATLPLLMMTFDLVYKFV